MGYWKHGGIVGVLGYGGGVIGRYSRGVVMNSPGVALFHTVRINQPSGFFYTGKALKEICDIWDKYGSGLTNVHGSTGDLVLLGTKTEHLEKHFRRILFARMGPLAVRFSAQNSSCCVGPARCGGPNYDTLDITYNLTQEFQDELHRPSFSYKFKIKSSGCCM